MTETEEKKKKGCWVFYKVPTGSPAEVEEDFHLTAPDGTVHRPDILGTLVDVHCDGQEVEFEIQVPGENVTRKVRAPIDTKERALLPFLPFRP
jgi:hypothetical protein